MMRTRMMIVGFGLFALPAALTAQQAEAGASVRVEARAETRGASEQDATQSSSQADAESRARFELARRAAEGEPGDEDRRSASRAEIEAAAEAMAAGAEREDVERVRKSTPRRRSMTASLRALASLTARGIPSADAAAAISAHLARGADDAAITRIGASARSAAHLNGSLLNGSAGSATAIGAAAAPLGGAAGIGAGLTGAIGGRIRF